MQCIPYLFFNSTRIASLSAVLLAMSLPLASCGKESEDTGEAEGITWAEHVAPILYRSCMGCHSGSSVWDMEGIGHFPLETHRDAESVAIYIQQVALSKRMPPWPGVAECEGRPAFLDDPSLSKDERLTILEWTESDLAEGDPSLAPPLPESVDTELEGQTHALYPASETQPDPDFDGYPCLLLDPELASDHWLTGLQGLPDNRALLASLVAWAVPPDRVEEVKESVEGSHCFGLEPAPGLDLLGSWSPGSAPFEPPTGSGIPMPAGSQVLVRFHHHVWQGEDVAPDRSGVGLRLTATQPDQIARMIALGNATGSPELQVQGGESSAEFKVPVNRPHIEEMHYGATSDRIGSIWAVGAWMHWSGIEMTLTLSGSEDSCLLAVEEWRPDWVRLYRYDSSDTLPSWGNQDTLRIRCFYENSTHNDLLMEALEEAGQEEPADMLLGDSYTDEACLAVVGILQAAP